MNIVYSSSDSYAEFCGISLLSLLETNKAVKNIDVFIIDNGISTKNKNRLFQIVLAHERKVTFLDRIDLENLSGTKINCGRWNIGTFFRLFLGSILPPNVDRVIYLDCDTIVRHDLSAIYNLDLGNCSVAGADDCRSDLYRINIGENAGSIYINNGFLLIDLNKWRMDKTEESFLKFINKYKGDITYVDQGVLNGVLGSLGQIKEISPVYNAQRIFFDFNYQELICLRKPTHCLDKEDYRLATTDPVVVHFTPVFISGTRPWNPKDKHKFTKEFRDLKALSPWKEEPLRRDDRKPLKKIMTVFCKICPRKLMILIMSYLHSKWYPRKRIKTMNKLAQEK